MVCWRVVEGLSAEPRSRASPRGRDTVARGFAVEGAPERAAMVTRPSEGTEPPSSSGLGRLPFTQVTRVRIPLGVPDLDTSSFRFTSRSRGAVWSARRPVKPEVAGSNPVGTASSSCPGLRGRDRKRPGRVAQLAERPPEKRKVTGSTPVPTTQRNPCLRQGFRRVRGPGSGPRSGQSQGRSALGSRRRLRR
jgi:hypothetical protein